VFLYISKTKVDTILPDIPLVAQKTISSELGVDLKFFKAIRKEERATLNSDVARLRAAEKYISISKAVGTLSDPGSWIEDTADVYFYTIQNEPEVVFFAGEKGDTVFALGGSRYHIVGDCRGENSLRGMSFLPRLISALKNRLRIPDPEGDKDETVSRSLGAGVSGGTQAWIGPIREMAGNTSDEKQKVKFLAKLLLKEQVTWDSRTHILATPLYIKLDE
jgi:hypothetical protein